MQINSNSFSSRFFWGGQFRIVERRFPRLFSCLLWRASSWLCDFLSCVEWTNSWSDKRVKARCPDDWTERQGESRTKKENNFLFLFFGFSFCFDFEPSRRVAALSTEYLKSSVGPPPVCPRLSPNRLWLNVIAVAVRERTASSPIALNYFVKEGGNWRDSENWSEPKINSNFIFL